MLLNSLFSLPQVHNFTIYRSVVSCDRFLGKIKNAEIKQANIINSWGKNIYVKIPVINSRGVVNHCNTWVRSECFLSIKQIKQKFKDKEK